MLYYILYPLKELFSPFNVLKYITFRAAMAFITALVINFIIAPRIIAWLKKKKRLQIIREDAPARHMSKEGTPTMGGIIIIISLLISVLLWARLDNRYIILLLVSTVYLGLLGFIDDYASSVKGKKKGISPSFKIAWQVVLGLFIAGYFYFQPSLDHNAYSIAMPFIKDMFIHLGSAYILFVMVLIVATSNAVNITDGLDGLAIGCIIFAAMTYAVISYISGHIEFSRYLFLPYIKDSGEISVFLMTLAGAGLGFLWYNVFPAQIFMGDTASLFMGGVIGISSIIIKQEMLLVIVGGVFLMEIVSVIIQVLSFRLRGKRVFKMAPLHHHFELLGWSEPQIVIR
ncbi:phospho-N-acetylmuramoyl-pentapeptide-transferase, partial [Elusimicrobiota bacterium]